MNEVLYPVRAIPVSELVLLLNISFTVPNGATWSTCILFFFFFFLISVYKVAIYFISCFYSRYASRLVTCNRSFDFHGTAGNYCMLFHLLQVKNKIRTISSPKCFAWTQSLIQTH